jgi:hypothetical protein
MGLLNISIATMPQSTTHAMLQEHKALPKICLLNLATIRDFLRQIDDGRTAVDSVFRTPSRSGSALDLLESPINKEDRCAEYDVSMFSPPQRRALKDERKAIKEGLVVNKKKELIDFQRDILDH